MKVELAAEYKFLFRIVSSLTFILICSSVICQKSIDIRASVFPKYKKDGVVQIQNNIQFFYNFNSPIQYVRLSVGLEFQYLQSNKNNYSCTNCSPREQSGTPLTLGEITSYSVDSYRNSLRSGLFIQAKWEKQKDTKLKLIPSVYLFFNRTLFSNRYQDRIWGFKDGTTFEQPKFTLNSDSNKGRLALYFTPELKFEYLVIPKWDLRIGVLSKLDLSFSGNNLAFGGYFLKRIR